MTADEPAPARRADPATLSLDENAGGGPSTAEPWVPPRPFPVAAAMTGSPLDRAAELRNRPAAQEALWGGADGAVLTLWRGKPPILFDQDGPRLAWAEPSAVDAAGFGAERVLLGRAVSENAAAGAGRFAVDLSTLEEPEAAPLWTDPVKFIDLRSIGPDLPRAEAAITAEAKALIEWHGAHPRCARCGAATRMAIGGWRRDCPECGAKHFPRTDPVVIMLATRTGPDGVERVLLGRQPGWPGNMHSLLAGYVEPGETIEEAALRETVEEAGVAVGRAAYLTCQPWPFPSTLMIGVWVEVLSDALSPDLEELETCRWASKAEVRAALRGESDRLDAPRVDAIARTLLEAWVAGKVASPTV
ncbi:MAG: NAD(+) diphosphatase [Pseudomonadota bacterium]